MASPPAIQAPNRLPAISREALQRKRNTQEALSYQVRVLYVQFGVELHDRQSFFVAWEGDYNSEAPAKPGSRQKGCKPNAYLRFNEGREGENPRSLQIEISGSSQKEMYRITIPMGQIRSVESVWDRMPFIIMRLYNPPSFEAKPQLASLTRDPTKDVKHSWQRLSAPQGAREHVVAFASRTIRLVFASDPKHMKNFLRMSQLSRLPILPISLHGNPTYGGLRRGDPKKMAAQFPWAIAFQCDALLRNGVLLPREIMNLKEGVERLLAIGVRFAEEVLRLFVVLVPNLYENKETAFDCLKRSETDCTNRLLSFANSEPRLGVFRSRHVLVTPTSYHLEGPYDEQSNRVIRMFGPEFEEHFIRVKFGDEGGTSYRHHWEVENSKFLAKQVGTILNEGLEIAGRHFDFLAYSASGLRQQSFWFVAPFSHPAFGEVEAHTIRVGLGNFSRVINCPARYGACMSQALSSIDPSVDLVPNEIEVINDVEAETQVLDGGLKPQKLVWTDGQGTISPDLADEIWVMHHKNRPKRVKDKAETEEVRPRAYQIQLGGYRGVVSVDYRLKGKRLIRVRPSMEKFDSGGPHPLRIEVSEAFNRPSPMYLNRPLIMILDTLGVKHSTFIKLQEEAMETAQAALDHPDSFATLMEMYELGKAFELPNLLRRLSRYNLQDLHNRDPFFRKLSCFSLYHAKRELKFHARIPVPGSWEVVGVADEHNQLGDGEIFACIHLQGRQPIFLEGPILICRSQTVHPGDVQLVTAVGKPEAASPYAIENLANTVIFSVKGKRPLAACLGGGDLDGDLYYLITNPELHPPKYEIPAWNDEYETHTLDRDSTITDIVDFVIEYMIHDTLGLIEVNHLRLADQRPEGVLDADCIRYAKLYSEATDYPETGKAITIDDMPKPKDIPDWDCPESSNPNNGDYYESTRALGALFRAVQLGDPEPGPLEDPVDREDFIRNALQEKVFDILNSHGVQPGDSEFFHRLFASFSCELKYQCAIHGIPQSVNSSLTEEEVVIGTILGKTTATNESQKRRDLMERLAKQSQDLVQQIKCEILGDRSALSPQEQLARAWTCLDVGWEITGANKFGRNSFFLVAFTSVLDLLHELDNAEHEESF